MGVHVSGLGKAPTIKALEDGKYIFQVKGATVETKVSQAGNEYSQLKIEYEVKEGELQDGKYDPAGRTFTNFIFLPNPESDYYEANVSRFKTDIVNHGLDEDRITDDLDEWVPDMIGLKVKATLSTKPDKNNPQYERTTVRVKPYIK